MKKIIDNWRHEIIQFNLISIGKKWTFFNVIRKRFRLTFNFFYIQIFWQQSKLQCVTMDAVKCEKHNHTQAPMRTSCITKTIHRLNCIELFDLFHCCYLHFIVVTLHIIHFERNIKDWVFSIEMVSWPTKKKQTKPVWIAWMKLNLFIYLCFSRPRNY